MRLHEFGFQARNLEGTGSKTSSGYGLLCGSVLRSP